jgi:hypothetical protein
MSEDRSSIERLERLVTSGVIVVAPVTVLSALLFYFGYVSSRSQYEYFGIDVDTIGLGTRDYVMRSPQPLLMPLLALALVGIGLLVVHTSVRRRVGTAVAGMAEEDPARAAEAAGVVGSAKHLARGAVVAGSAVLGIGIALLFSYAQLRDWAFYNLVTPLMITVGTALIAYGSRVQDLIRRWSAPPTSDVVAVPIAPSLRYGHRSELLRRASRLLLYLVITAGIFWTTATVAQWSGRGLAQYQAQHLDQLPSVILDTKERLFLRSPGIEETQLPASQGQTFHYRYRNLRLLIHGNDRMFLVPNQWSASDTTLVVVLDGSVRVQFQFQNEPP